MTYYGSSEYRCCGMHVRKGAQIIGVIGLVLGIFILLGAVFYNHTFGSYVDGIVTIIIYAALIVASQKHIAKWYLPFLILNMLFIIFKVLYVIFLVFMLVTMPPSWQKYVYPYPVAHEERVVVAEGPVEDARITSGRVVDRRVVAHDVEDEARVQTGAMIAILAIGLLLNLFFQYVVYRAYKSLKDEDNVSPRVATGYHNTTTTTTGAHSTYVANVPTTMPTRGVV
jgi:hypothetical protein